MGVTCSFASVTCSFVGVTCSFVGVTCSLDPIAFRFQNDEYCNTYTVAKIQLKKGGKALRISEIFVLILHITAICIQAQTANFCTAVTVMF